MKDVVSGKVVQVNDKYTKYLKNAFIRKNTWKSCKKHNLSKKNLSKRTQKMSKKLLNKHVKEYLKT